MGDGMGVEVKLYARVLFNIFGSFNASTAYPDKRGFSLGAPKNVFRWWVCSFGVGLTRGSNFPFLPSKPFLNLQNKAIILHGSE